MAIQRSHIDVINYRRGMLTGSCLATLLAAMSAIALADLGPQWTVRDGDWAWSREVIPMIRQGDPAGTHVALSRDVTGAEGAWRAVVEPSSGTEEAGIWLQATGSLDTGFTVTLGGNPGLGGFALKTSDGAVIWEDRYAPWMSYHPYVLEGIVESGRVRAQLFEADGATLISQSPWVAVDAKITGVQGAIGLYTRNGIARFWGWERSTEPLSPIVPDAPNKRRLVQEDDSPWAVVGPGNWMWTTGERNRLRQYATVERSSAIHRATRGALRQWECRVQVDPGAGGAGMLFQTNEDATQGFIAWLGGQYGAGSLMLYRLPVDALWSGKQDNWHYDVEYLIRAETRGDEARAQLLQADGQTVIQDSGWVKVGAEDASREGAVGFMTWRGTAQFWGFSEQTTDGSARQQNLVAASALGGDWAVIGDGVWSWADEGRTQLRQTGAPKQAIAVDAAVSGIMGTWRCRVRIPNGTGGAGLVFQASRGASQGFAALLTEKGFVLRNLSGKVMWEDAGAKWERDAEYVIEGEVMTDRIAARLLAADGKTLVSECPAVYVPDTNNDRTGMIGAIAEGGPATFTELARQ